MKIRLYASSWATHKHESLPDSGGISKKNEPRTHEGDSEIQAGQEEQGCGGQGGSSGNGPDQHSNPPGWDTGMPRDPHALQEPNHCVNTPHHVETWQTDNHILLTTLPPRQGLPEVGVGRGEAESKACGGDSQRSVPN